MSFTIHKHDHAGRKPWASIPAHAGTYHVGDALYVYGGKVAPVGEEGCYMGVVKYVSMAERTVQEGQLLPVVRVTSNEIYKTTGAADGEAVVGNLVAVYVDRIAPGEEGRFEIVQIDGDEVYGRFLESDRIV